GDVDLAKSRLAGGARHSPAQPSDVAPAERVTVASHPANTTTAVFRGRGGGAGVGTQTRR
ncbi:MoxR family ATPase, partial [Rhodococcus sp. CC-R104]|nr:MoxR family ATPase [Rhodococcus sp. CC-R104]